MLISPISSSKFYSLSYPSKTKKLTVSFVNVDYQNTLSIERQFFEIVVTYVDSLVIDTMF